MADDMESSNSDLNVNRTYYDWAIPLPPIQPSIINIEGDVNTTVTSVNDVAGPVINLTSTLSGVSFSSGANPITLAGTLGPTSGGTGLTTYAQGDLLYSSATNVLAKLPKDANATRYLSNTGTSNNPAWAQIDLTNGVTGILSNANGGGAKNNVTNAAPTVNDDSGDGYSVHSLWTDTTGPTTYICQNAAAGAAVWTQIAP